EERLLLLLLLEDLRVLRERERLVLRVLVAVLDPPALPLDRERAEVAARQARERIRDVVREASLRLRHPLHQRRDRWLAAGSKERAHRRELHLLVRIFDERFRGLLDDPLVLELREDAEAHEAHLPMLALEPARELADVPFRILAKEAHERRSLHLGLVGANERLRLRQDLRVLHVLERPEERDFD